MTRPPHRGLVAFGVVALVGACGPAPEEPAPSGPGLASLQTWRGVSAPDAQDLAAVGLTDVAGDTVEVPVTAPSDPCDPTGVTSLAGVDDWEEGQSVLLESEGLVSYGVQVWRFDGPDGPRQAIGALTAAAKDCRVPEDQGVTVTAIPPSRADPGTLATGWDLAVEGTSTSRRTAYIVVERSLVQVTLGYRTGETALPDDAASLLSARVAGRLTPVERALVEQDADTQEA